MSKTVADFMLERLANGASTASTATRATASTASSARSTAHGRRSSSFRSRHEEMAAFMACAHAKFTGEVGVCLATSGPGAIHLLNGLYDAKLDHQPVVAIVGQQALTALGGNYQQEVDLVSLFKDVAHEYVDWSPTPAQMRHLVDRAIRIAHAERTVTCIIIPNDVRPRGGREPPRAHGTIHSGVGYSRAAGGPARRRPRAGGRVLNAGEKVAMLVGQGALGAADEVIEVAELPRRRRRQGAARARRAPGRPPVRDRLDRPARHQAELGPDDGLRHAADGRLELPVLGVPARGGRRRAGSRSTSTAG